MSLQSCLVLNSRHRIGNLSFALVASLILSGCAGSTKNSSGQAGSGWGIGILNGSWLSWIDPAGTDPPQRINLRLCWPFASQSSAFPTAKVIAVSSGGQFLATLGGLADRSDGPLILADARTGRVVKTFNVSDAGAAAAFLPPDDRRFLLCWEEDQRLRAAIFDTATNSVRAELPDTGYRVNGFVFSADRSKLLFDHVLDARHNTYDFLNLSSLRFTESLPLPTDGSCSFLDMRGEMLLFREVEDNIAAVKCWRFVQTNSSALVIGKNAIQNQDVSSAPFLAGTGDRIVSCRGADVYISSSQDVQPSFHLRLGAPITSFTVHPEGNPTALIVGPNLVLVDVYTGRVLSRFRNATGKRAGEDVSLFWLKKNSD